MPPQTLSFHNYAKEAFDRTAKVPLLGRLPLNKMGLAAFAVLGLWNPGFWFLGAAGELAYLFLRATSPRFQNLIEGERLLAAHESWAEKISQAVDRLSTRSRERYRRLLEQCRSALGITDTLENDSLGNFRDMRARSLNQLLAIFLRLLTSREVIEGNLKGLNRAALQNEVAELEKRLAAAGEDSALSRSLSGTIAIQTKRLNNLGKAASNLEVIDAELRRIEKQVELIREESAVTGRPEALSVHLDAVTNTMSETSRWMDEHNEFFHSLDGHTMAGELTKLPEFPDAPEVVEESEDQAVAQ